MPLASSGRAFLGRQAPHIHPPGGGTANTARSIHIPAFVRPNVPSTTSTAQTVFKQTRTLLSRFVAHLTTPGTIRSPISHAPSAVRAFSGPGSHRTIQQGLSFPVRHALSRPLQAPYLPRPPAVPRATTQVGLGLARNFSTARPVFQNLAENVPVAGRAFWEADWDVRMQKEREYMRVQRQTKREQKKARKEQQQPREDVRTAAQTEAEIKQAALDHYFPAAAVPEVTTVLLIPLAPTPTARLPLSASPLPSSHPLLPLHDLGTIHANHGTHTLRVSSLFARLDAAAVFDEPGVRCEARGDPRGLCTVLEVRFEGWDAARVRSVLGEAGSGWCVLEELHNDNAVDSEAASLDDALDAMSSAGSEAGVAWHEGLGLGAQMDPARSFVLPTLDFSAASASVLADSWHVPAPPSPLLSPLPDTTPTTPFELSPGNLSDLASHDAFMSWAVADSDTSSDSFLDVSDGDLNASWASLSSGSGSPDVVLSPPSESWLGFGFSSEFGARMRDVRAEGPREDMF